MSVKIIIIGQSILLTLLQYWAVGEISLLTSQYY